MSVQNAARRRHLSSAVFVIDALTLDSRQYAWWLSFY